MVQQVVMENGAMRVAAANEKTGLSMSIGREATAAGVTLAASQLLCDLLVRSGPGAAYSDTMPTGTLMDTAFAAMVPIGNSFTVRIANRVAAIQTFVAGAGFTAVAGGATTIAASVSSLVIITRTAVNTWTYEIMA